LNLPTLVDIRLFRNRAFAAGMGIALAYFGGFTAIFFIASLLIQSGFQHSALYAGLCMVPFSLGSLVAASQSDRVAQRLGRTCLTIGAGLVMIGIAGLIVTLHYAGTALNGWELAPWFLIAGSGSGLVVAPNVALVLAGVPRQDAGSASGVLSTAQRIGQAIGVCLVGIVLFGVLQSNANSSAGSVTTGLHNDLVAAQMPAAQIDGAVANFGSCFERRSSASDPNAVPAGCQATDPAATDPVSKAFAKAGKNALADNFSTAAQQALAVSLILVAVTFLLIFLLPRRRDEGSRQPAPPSE
jgi:MFS family permease